MHTALIFYPAAISLIVLALMSIFSNKVVYSLVAAICVFFLSGLIFYLLGAEYVAVVQLAIYGLAVPIILAFALMFTNTRRENESVNLAPRRYVIYFAIGLLVLSLVYLVLISFNVFQTPVFAPMQESVNSIRVFDALSNGFLKSYIIAFELVSVLIFAVVVGVSDNAK